MLEKGIAVVTVGFPATGLYLFFIWKNLILSVILNN